MPFLHLGYQEIFSERNKLVDIYLFEEHIPNCK